MQKFFIIALLTLSTTYQLYCMDNNEEEIIVYIDDNGELPITSHDMISCKENNKPKKKSSNVFLKTKTADKTEFESSSNGAHKQKYNVRFYRLPINRGTMDK